MRHPEAIGAIFLMARGILPHLESTERSDGDAGALFAPLSERAESGNKYKLFSF